MPMKTYEAVAIVRPDLDDEATGAVVERIHQRITEHGGTIISSERWGKRRLAYPIRRYRDGLYVVSVFSIDGSQIARVRQGLALQEDLLRFAIVVHHPSAPPQSVSAPTPTPGEPSPPSSQAQPTAHEPAQVTPGGDEDV